MSCLWYLFATPAGKRYRAISWIYLITLGALFVARGRDYYLAPAYPMLLAAGAVWGEQWVHSLTPGSAVAVRRITRRSLAIAGLCCISTTLPIAPLNSAWWRFANNVNGGVFDEQVGWPDFVAKVSEVRDSLAPQERARLGILAGDEGEAGAVNLYGPAHALPRAISGMNSNWYRGYGDPPPETLIVLGEHREFLDQNFESCTLAGTLLIATESPIAPSPGGTRFSSADTCGSPGPNSGNIFVITAELRAFLPSLFHFRRRAHLHRAAIALVV
jgi:hypothetical protein